MLGSSHAASGMVVGLATLPWAAAGAPWWVQAGWVSVCGGAAVLPDLDHPESKVSRMWGPITGALAVLVARVSRGHRAGTHDAVLAPVGVAVGAWLASWWLPAFAVVVALTLGLVLRVTVLRRGGILTWMANLTASAVLGWGLAQYPALVDAGHTLLPVALAIGVWTHQAGDLLTPEGIPVPIVWLFDPRRRVGLGLFTTGQQVERFLIGPALAATVFVMACWQAGIYSPAHLADMLHTWMINRSR